MNNKLLLHNFFFELKIDWNGPFFNHQPFRRLFTLDDKVKKFARLAWQPWDTRANINYYFLTLFLCQQSDMRCDENDANKRRPSMSDCMDDLPVKKVFYQEEEISNSELIPILRRTDYDRALLSRAISFFFSKKNFAPLGEKQLFGCRPDTASFQQ